MNLWHLIPKELQDHKQWVCANDHKMPVNPNNGQLASVDDPDSWSDFMTAATVAISNGWDIGFVLTKNDPYCIIDLDDPNKVKDLEKRQRAIEATKYCLDNFATYQERSRSGTGYHIVCRAEIAEGFNAGGVEGYSDGRHIILTGDIINEQNINECQTLVTDIYAQFKKFYGASKIQIESVESNRTDEEIIELILNSGNSAKAELLWHGRWSEVAEGYGSQSDADFALHNMIYHYTKDVDQMQRIWLQSPLFLNTPDPVKKNRKARPDYIEYSIRKIKATEVPPVDLSAIAKQVEQAPMPDPEPTVVETELDYPPGLIGEIAQYIYTSAPRPIKEAGLVGAIALFAGIVGRQYNISGTGLNQYIVFMAPTGSGKEAIKSGMVRLLQNVQQTQMIPNAIDYYLSKDLASGQALVKVLSEKPCGFNIMGEFGFMLRRFSHNKASTADLALKKVILDLYTGSGKGSVVSGLAYSDKEKNVDAMNSVALTILGEGTREGILDQLSEADIIDGFLTRFLVFDFKGKRSYQQADHSFDPSPNLSKRLADVLLTVIHMQNNNGVYDIPLDQEAQQFITQYDREITDRMNSLTESATKSLWNRAILKILKLSGLLAVGVNHLNPIVTMTEVNWAVNLVVNDINSLIQRFEAGDVGDDHNAQNNAVINAFIDYDRLTDDKKIKSYKVPKALIGHPVIPYCYLRRKLKRHSAFINEKDTSRAIQNHLIDMEKAGILVKMPPDQVRKEFGLRSEVYVRGESFG